MSWASNNRWENSSRGIITSETSFAHAGSIINHQGSYFVITHVCLLIETWKKQIYENNM